MRCPVDGPERDDQPEGVGHVRSAENAVLGPRVVFKACKRHDEHSIMLITRTTDTCGRQPRP